MAKQSQYLDGSEGNRSARVVIGPLFAAQIGKPKEGRVEYWDKASPGLGLRVSASGAKSWVAMYRVGGKQVRETLGTLKDIPSVGTARRRAEASADKAKDGVNPVVERRAKTELDAENTVKAAAARWLAEGERDLKPKTVAGYRQIFDHDVLPRWGARPLAEIKKGDVLELLNDKAEKRDRRRTGVTGGAAVQANRVKTRLATFFRWCLDKDLIASDPTAGVRRPAREVARDRVLSDDELRAFWTATAGLDAKRSDAVAVGALFRVMLVTGQREGEVAGMRRSEIDVARHEWTIPGVRSKNGKEHVVALSGLALELLEDARERQAEARKRRAEAPERMRGARLAAAQAEDDLVFSVTGKAPGVGFAKAKAKLDAAMVKALSGAALPGWVLHDLRRSATSLMARLGIEPHVADRVLNHTAGTIRGVAATYNRFQYLDERRLALDALGRFVRLLVEDRLPGHVAEARVKLWLRAERERGEREAAGNVVDLSTARVAG